MPAYNDQLRLGAAQLLRPGAGGVAGAHRCVYADLGRSRADQSAQSVLLIRRPALPALFDHPLS